VGVDQEKVKILEGMKVDLEWDDDHILPPVIRPDLSFFWQRMNEVSIREVEVGEGEEILDVGCGRAFDAIQLAKKGGQCFGLESSNRMINLAREQIVKDGTEVNLVQGIGEYLPFKDSSLDKVICKGSIDHFPDPSKAFEEMARVLKPHGKAIIVVANFESIGFKLQRYLFRIRSILPWWRTEDAQVWQIPADHIYKFDYPFSKRLLAPHFKMERSIGISLFFGFPGWGRLLAWLPEGFYFAILNILDRVARHFPSLSDGILIKCSPISREIQT
jgi:ubiquinone/menaquinone biosynthesis C-methylase UbiE